MPVADDHLHLSFLGATETVTGSKFLLELDGARVLVDCGLFQGLKALRRRNWERLPVPASSIDAVVITHAHIDHTGYLPALVEQGFDGPIFCTPVTAELCGILLPDAAHLQEEDARIANRRKSSRHTPALPLFDRADAERALALLHPVPFGEEVEAVAGVTARFQPVGHILGAASVLIRAGGVRAFFSGDVGRPADPITRVPAPVPACDVVVCESTYGNRRHPTEDPAVALGEVVRRTVKRHGSVLIPAFAVGRAQTVLHLLAELRHRGELPDVPVYLNSPMAIDTTELFLRHPDEHRLSSEQVQAMRDGVTFVRTAEESMRLTASSEEMIVISASGMASGGRVIHHLERMAPNPRNTVLFVGYQAAGTRGDAMVSGAGEIKIFGEYVPVNAEVAVLDGLSAHADSSELVDWLETAPEAPRRTYLVHGEPAAQDNLRRLIGDRLGWVVDIPGYLDRVTLR